MPLCQLCSTIPRNLFSSARDTQCSHVHHKDLVALRDSAAEGCDACAIFYDAVLRRAEGERFLDTFGNELDLSHQVQLRSTKFGEQYVCVNWADVGKIRGIDVPMDWNDAAVSEIPQAVGTTSSLQHQASTLKWWMQNCSNEHPDCIKLQPNHYTPRRLIDVNAGDSSTVRLVDTRATSLSEIDYVAASHCWGSTMPLSAKTLSSSIDGHRKCIHLSDLTQTFVDFIEITRMIGIRYVWIDSLCIVQDSHDDWEAEASQMEAVYSNALITIAASGSANGHGGCRLGNSKEVVLGSVDLAWSEEAEAGADQGLRIRISSQPTGSIVNVLLQDPLVQRGWTLQERELSPRVVHYSLDTIRWECPSLKASLQYPWGDTLSFNGALRVFDNGQIHHQEPESGAFLDKLRENRNAWFDVVSRYTKRQLTNQSDVLPAISGIARRFARTSGDEYRAGIFKSHGVIALVWAVEGEWKKEWTKSERPDEYLAPSWSWASVRGHVDWFWTLKQKQSDHIDERFTPKILEISVTPAGNDIFGKVSGGKLRLRGLMVPGIAQWRDSDNLRQDERAILVVQNKEIVNVGTIKFDVPQEACDGLCFFACRRESQYGWIDALGLVPSGSSLGEFQRVGLAKSKNESWWNDAPTVEISII